MLIPVRTVIIQGGVSFGSAACMPFQSPIVY
jgi:hypothetical protein